ncbi:hypothetical protein GS538_09280 [Rhodococcus hoagii]|nr:hypothetical protein [Prescottella equi]
MTEPVNPLVYEGTAVYRNHFDLRDPELLEEAEAAATAIRMADLAQQPITSGNFDLAHLQQIHHYVMQDVYPWAGEIRTVQSWVGNTGIPHDKPEDIQAHADRLFAELRDNDYLRGLPHGEFTAALAEHWADLTSLHPFVDGNSRTQRIYVDQLARQAGWEIEWREASSPAIQSARNVGFLLDEGRILNDVLEPLVVEPGTVPAHAVAAPGRPTEMTYGQHWQAMLDHAESRPDEVYTWASQHTHPPAGEHPDRQRLAEAAREAQHQTQRQAEVEAERQRAEHRRAVDRRRLPTPESRGHHL